MIKHLYVHVPFCRTICSYCDFCHRVYDKKSAELYLNRIKEETKECSDNYETIYIGGGTPTALSDEELDKLLSNFDNYSKKVKEYTIEANPESLTESKINIFLKHNINRISVGLQSSDDSELKLMNRHHSFDDVKDKVNLLRDKGINNISIDIMYSLPGQTMESLKKTVKDALSLKVPHLSLYSLTVEENSVFGKKSYKSLDEDTEADMYEYIVDTLVKYGYHQYEIANFCLPGYESKHNLGYWHYDDYLALGPGSTSKYNHQRIEKTNNIKTYLNNSELIENIEILSNEDEAFENLMMSLRLEEGLNISVFKDKYGFNPLDYYSEAIKKNSNYLKVNDNQLICTDREILNHILVDFLG